mmetsp:Transcript_19845/g.24479  ORF Transcript_19845/g.24479 Transcript_19845/m.24479 type:complete len:401 (-) Transcript_19845:1401-2603(-)
MADSIQQPFQRFNISPENLESSSSNDVPPPIIPILHRSNEAKRQSMKLSQLSPVCVLVVGMAGSGKTTLMASLQRSLSSPPEEKGDGEQEGKDQRTSTSTSIDESNSSSSNDKQRPVGYCLNLDPATKLVPFGASIDIRDTVDYKEVMKQHRLGPNGAIMTSLNLFSTKFDQVLEILENRSFPQEKKQSSSSKDEKSPTSPPKLLDYILVDTPGQIEAFTWSASGTIITSALSSSFPTVMAFVVDTPRCVASLNTFMSNMLYACSMFYRTRLPLIVVFNKCDVVGSEVCMEWMNDYEKFQEALDDFMSTDGGQGYYSSLTRSLSLVLDEFYQTLKKVGVSAATGDGIEEFWSVVQMAADDFDEGYVSDLKCKVDEQSAKKRALAKDSLRRMTQDIDEDDA